MFNKHLILLLINCCLCFSEVTISPSREIVIKEGDPLQIICSASEPVDFFFPKTISGLAITSPTSFSNESANGATKLTLERSKSVFGDTGWYGCVESSKNPRSLNEREILVTPDTYDEIEIKWVYVYVKSDVHPFIIDSKKYNVRVIGGHDLTLPCRPTSPEYNVTFHSSDNLFKPTVALARNEYDPKIGFIFRKVVTESQGLYFCEAENFSDKRMEINVFVYQASSASSSLSIYTESLQQMTLGDDFSMVCGVRRSESYDFAPLVWTTPKNTHPIGASENKFSEGVHHYTNKLTIRNVTDDDVGEYKCHFYGSGVIETTKVYLQFHSKKHVKVSPMIFSLGKNLIKKVDSSFLFFVVVDAYPLPTIQWLDPKGKVIQNDWSLEFSGVNGETFIISLKKFNLTVEDRGNYTIVVSNSAETKTVSFYLNVFVKVSVTTAPMVSEIFPKDDSVTAECEAEGDPAPIITWEYTNYFKNLTESSPESPLYKVTSTVEGTKRKSRIEVKVQGTGKLVCHASNVGSEDSAVVKILNVPVFMKLQQDPISNFKEVSISEGEPLTIDCYSSKEITFFFPLSGQTSKEITSFEQREHSARFKRQKAVYGDSGWYACVNVPEKNKELMENRFSFTPDQYDGLEVQWLYVFVKSREHLLLDFPKNLFDGNEYFFYQKNWNDVIVPCRVTSKDYKVELHTGLEKIYAEYDPKRGMIIRNVGKDTPFHYYCTATSENNRQETLAIAIDSSALDLWKTYQDPRSYILGTVNQELNVTVGSNITLNCSASVYRFQDTISWYNSSKSLNIGERVAVNGTKGEPLNLSQLTIKDVKKSDQGDYTCKAKLFDGYTVENHFHLHVSASAAVTTSVILQLSIILLFYFM